VRWCAALGTPAGARPEPLAPPGPPAAQVAEQQSLVARIDENVDETLANVDSAKAQLLKYLNSISGNRWLALKVFGVLIVFLCIFIFLL
jgi:syntaxin 5